MARNQHKSKVPKILGYASRKINTTIAPAERIDPKSPIIPWFAEDGNGYCQELINAYERSPTHRTCINVQVRMAKGDGVIVKRKDGEPYKGDCQLDGFLADVNGKGENFNSVFGRQVQDQSVFGNNLLRLTGGYVDHEDVSTVRLKNPNEDGRIEAGYLSNYWNDRSMGKLDKNIIETSLKDSKVIEVPLYDPNEEQDDALLFAREYAPGRKYYGIPHYYSVGAMRWIDIEYKIPTYNLGSIDNRFMPSGIFSLFGEPPGEMTSDEFLSDFLNQFTGEGNSSKLVAQILSDKDQAPMYQKLDDKPDGIFTELQDLAQQNILVMHQIHPSVFMAIAGKLGNGGNEVRQHYDQYYKMIIEPIQKICLEAWNSIILPMMGFGDYELDIANNNPISIASGVDITKILTPDELRDELGYAALGTVDHQKVLMVLTSQIPEQQKRVLLKYSGLDEDKINELFKQPNDNSTGDIAVPAQQEL